MAHKVSGGSKASQKGNVTGKRLGLKIFGDQAVKAGQIILRQRGTPYLNGLNTGLGRDHTIFSKITGIVKFYKNSLGRTVVRVEEKKKV
ncbi:50S ribosomal protein L27 [Patescibacteria group bacterium]|nr:50S ribosomal protein L27 [Patescibacteria group bacterium]